MYISRCGEDHKIRIRMGVEQVEKRSGEMMMFSRYSGVLKHGKTNDQ